MAKYVTIMDIARELGISKSTVSRALSGDTGNVKAGNLAEDIGDCRADGLSSQRTGCELSPAEYS